MFDHKDLSEYKLVIFPDFDGDAATIAKFVHEWPNSIRYKDKLKITTNIILESLFGIVNEALYSDQNFGLALSWIESDMILNRALGVEDVEALTAMFKIFLDKWILIFRQHSMIVDECFNWRYIGMLHDGSLMFERYTP